MFADIRPLADNTLMLEGKNPATFLLEPDIAHIVLHKTNDTLYILDTGATPFFRRRLLEATNSLRPFSRVIIINSHGHPDHTGNNSVLHEIAAADKRLYISRRGLPLVDYRSYFLRDFSELGQAFCFLEGLDYKPQLLESLYGQAGHSVGGFAEKLGQLTALAEELNFPRLLNPFFPQLLADLILRHFQPLEPAAETMIPLEESMAVPISVGGADFTGWNFDDDVLVLESRGHSPDGMIFYLPKVKVLYCGDETTVIPLFGDSDPGKALITVKKCLQLVQAGEVAALLDSHHPLLTASPAMPAFLQAMIDSHQGLEQLILGLLAQNPAGVTIEHLYLKMKQLDNPVLQGLFAWQFPVFAVFVKQIIYRYLRALGCPTRGGGHELLYLSPRT